MGSVNRILEGTLGLNLAIPITRWYKSAFEAGPGNIGDGPHYEERFSALKAEGFGVSVRRAFR